MKKIFLAVLAAVSMLSIPQLSVSEIKEGSIEISPFAGYYFLHKTDRAGFGLRGGYNFTRNWGLEGAYDYAGDPAEFLHADLLYHFTPEKAFNPFIFAGVGNAHMKPDDDSYDRILGEIGAGFKYSLSDNIAIRADIRDIQEKFNNVAATAGLVFTFGGKTTPARAQAGKYEAKPEPEPVTPPPAPKPAPSPPPPAPVAGTVKIILEGDIHFDFDKATLTKAATDILDSSIKTLNENAGSNVQIEGHACAHGDEDYNMALGEKRANAVKEYLVKKGIAADRMTTISYGETRLAMPEIPTPKNKESKEAKANRRVHFEVTVK